MFREGVVAQQFIELLWNAPDRDNFDAYELTYTPAFTGSPSSPINIPKDFTRLEVTELGPGLRYDFTLRTVRGTGQTQERGANNRLLVTTSESI